jgi:threonine synthase
LLPVRSESSLVTLYEGGTPLVHAGNLGRTLGHEKLYCKDETRNPSGAFKDRPISVGVSKAVELGFDTVTTASSGNGAASLSIYAAKGRLRCIVFVPEKTPMAKVAHAVTAGATVVRVRGDYSNSYALARAASARYRWMNITTTFLNPYTFEGDKTVAYELYRQLNDAAPDWIIVPTGAGPLLYGTCKGFEESARSGLGGSGHGGLGDRRSASRVREGRRPGGADHPQDERAGRIGQRCPDHRKRARAG